MKKSNKQRKPLAAEVAQRQGAATANATRSRASGCFKNSKKDANKKACRGKVTE